MPYALFDRDTFIARTGLGPDMKVLIIGPDSTTAIQIANHVETSVSVALLNPRQSRGLRSVSPPNLNPVSTTSAHLPFKSSSFDIIFSYHSLNYISPDHVPEILAQVHRTLKQDGRFAAMVWSLKTANKAQESHMMMLEILEQMGLIHLYRFDEVSRCLEAAGFEEITLELVPHQVPVPENWVRSHVRRMDGIIREYRLINGSLPNDIEQAVDVFEKHVKKYGEELLPSIQFTALRRAGLEGIDSVR